MCVTPILLNQKGKIVPVPCQRCFECIRRRKMFWQIRITAEANMSDVNFFSLLSYDEEHLPDPDLPDVKGIQKLVKRLRSRLSRFTDDQMPRKDQTRPIDLKYFIVSEYGEMRNRLHYHCIFFLKNVDPVFCNRVFWKTFLEDTWSQGFASAFDLQPQNIGYVCKYIQKDYNMLLSSRLGKSYDKSNLYDDGKSLPSFPVRGKLLPAPPSWSRELLGDQEYNLRALALANNDHKVNKLSYKDRITLNQGFIEDNPRYKPKEDKPFIDNSDILPNGEI